MSKLFIIILITMSMTPAWASSLDQWVEEALRSHPEIAALAAEIDAARAEKRGASLRPAQELSIDGGYKETDVDSGYVAGAGLTMSTERGGKREVRTALADNNILQAEQALSAFKNELMLRIKTLGISYLIAQNNAVATEEIASRSAELINQLKQRPVAGPPAFLELKLIEASLLEVQHTARSYLAERDSLAIALNSLLGRPGNEPVNIDAVLQPPDLDFDRDELMKKLENGAPLQAKLAEQARQALEVTAAELEAKPDISWGPFVEHEDAGEVETVVGLSFSFPLSGSKRNEGNVAAAQARQLSVDAKLIQARRELQGELEHNMRMAELAMEQVRSIPSEMIEELRGAASLADRQYRLGTISVQLFLDVQSEFLAVQQLYHEALLSAWEHAFEIQRLTGTLTEKAL